MYMFVIDFNKYRVFHIYCRSENSLAVRGINTITFPTNVTVAGLVVMEQVPFVHKSRVFIWFQLPGIDDFQSII